MRIAIARIANVFEWNTEGIFFWNASPITFAMPRSAASWVNIPMMSAAPRIAETAEATRPPPGAFSFQVFHAAHRKMPPIASLRMKGAKKE